MKIFIDTANIDAIKKYAFILDGVTTNPTLIAKEGKRFDDVVKEICRIVDGPISAETVKEDAKGMVEDARELSRIHKNITVKIPMTVEGLKAVKQLSREGIKTNVTLVFSPSQAMLAAKAGATFVSPFIGRLDDISEDGMKMIQDTVKIFQNYGFKTEIIVASVRHPMHVVQAAMVGAHICTIPPDVLDKLFKHPLTDSGIEKFLKDYKTIPK